MRYWLAVIVILTLPVCGQVKVTYLANEGVLLESGRARVLIDALFRDSLDDYARHDHDTQERIETGRPPLDGITAALASHYHLDHWDAGAVSRFLRSNPAAVFISTPQATGMIPSSLKPRVRSMWPEGAGGLRWSAEGIEVEAIPLKHSTTQNLCFRVSMGGRVLMHLGDADPEQAAFDALMARERPDVAMVPFWWLMNRQAIAFIGERWKPRAVVAIHFGAEDAVKSAPAVRKAMPSAWLCTRQGESKVY